VKVGVKSANDTISNIVLLGGQHGTGYDFCEHEPAYVSGWVYHDANNNGRRDAGEEAIGGVTIVLLDAGGTQVATTVTDVTGFYKFNNLSAGTYTLRQTHPAGWLDGLDCGRDDRRRRRRLGGQSGRPDQRGQAPLGRQRHQLQLRRAEAGQHPGAGVGRSGRRLRL
jgi:hypothetical protein